MLKQAFCFYCSTHITRASCQKGPTRHAYAWQIGPFWQDTLDLFRVYREIYWGPYYWQTLISWISTGIRVWINDFIHVKQWDENINPRSTGSWIAVAAVRVQMNIYIPHKTVGLITYPRPCSHWEVQSSLISHPWIFRHDLKKIIEDSLNHIHRSWAAMSL